MVVDIPKAYGLILSKDWSAKLNGYFSTDWSHFWLPYNNFQNHIKVLREPDMKYNVMQLEGKNEPINFSHSDIRFWVIILLSLNQETIKHKKPMINKTHNPSSYNFHGLIRLTAT